MPPAWGYQHQPQFLKWRTWAQPARPAHSLVSLSFYFFLIFCLHDFCKGIIHLYRKRTGDYYKISFNDNRKNKDKIFT